MYEISKARLLQIAKDSPKSKVKIKQWYPDVFDFKKGWYTFNSGTYKYNIYLNDSEALSGYGTMDGNWSRLLAGHSDWNPQRVNDEDVLELLVTIGKNNGKIQNDENTTLWTYNEEEDSIKNGDGFIVYYKGSWHLSTTSSSNSSWEGVGWYKYTWQYSRSSSIGYVYMISQEDRIGYGFYDGNYRDAVYTDSATSFRKCSNEEIREIMITEARRRGYTSENIVSLGGDSSFRSNLDSWSFHGNTLYAESNGNGGMIIYTNGVWASKR